jgi:dTDP-glucose 4,6-dehydratase
MKKKYLITGGCGFIGSSLIRLILESENNFVINIDKISYASNKDSIHNANKNNYLLIEDDINNPELLESTILKYEPDFVIHLAAESHVDRSIDDPESFINSNILGTYNILQSSLKFWKNLDKLKKDSFRLIYVSTDEVYGSESNKSIFFSEESSIKPNSPYAASKAAGDILARSWYKTYKLPVITTNSSNNYGIWQFPEKLIPLVVKKCITEEKIPVYGDGKQVRDWINVNDNTQAILAVLSKGRVGEKYNIGASNELTNISIVEEICSIFDNLIPRKAGKYSDLITFVDDRPAHDFRYALNIDKIINETNWRPSISFSDGILETIQWYLKNREWLLDVTKDRYDGKRLGLIKK